MKLIILISLILFSCCPAHKDVMNGKAIQKWERKKKFTAKVIDIKKWKDYDLWTVTFYNLKEGQFRQVYNCKPNFKSGTWVTK